MKLRFLFVLAPALLGWSGFATAGFNQGVLSFDGVAEEWRYQGLTQAFGVSKNCAYDDAGVTLAVVSSSADVGFNRKKDKLGATGSGQNCGDTNAGQSIAFELGAVFAADELIETTSVAALLKGNAVVEAKVFKNDVEAPDSYILRSGFSVECTNGLPTTAPAVNETYAFPCSADSNPDSEKLFTWTFPAQPADSQYEYDRVEFHVTNGDFGIQTADFTIVRPSDGELTCVTDGGFNEGDDFTEPEPFLEIFLAGEGAAIPGTKVQCKRIPNRDGSDCVPVDYSIEATCEGDTCSTTFVHEDQDDVPRDALAFVCEAWWPEKPADFAEGAPIVPKTQQFWGPSNEQGSDLDYCPGITPVFADNCAPTNDDQFLLSDALGSANGGTVVPACASSNLLSSYADVLVGTTDEFPEIEDRDQCGTNTCSVDGVQLGCLLDERNFIVEDFDRPEINTNVKQFQRWLLQGDYSFSKSFTGSGR